MPFPRKLRVAGKRKAKPPTKIVTSGRAPKCKHCGVAHRPDGLLYRVHKSKYGMS